MDNVPEEDNSPEEDDVPAVDNVPDEANVPIEEDMVVESIVPREDSVPEDLNVLQISNVREFQQFRGPISVPDRRGTRKAVIPVSMGHSASYRNFGVNTRVLKSESGPDFVEVLVTIKVLVYIPSPGIVVNVRQSFKYCVKDEVWKDIVLFGIVLFGIPGWPNPLWDIISLLAAADRRQ